jgi:hypothetical protein
MKTKASTSTDYIFECIKESMNKIKTKEEKEEDFYQHKNIKTYVQHFFIKLYKALGKVNFHIFTTVKIGKT